MRCWTSQAAGRVAKPERTRFLGLPAAAWWVSAITVGVLITVVSLLPPRGTPGPQIADLGEVVATIGHIVGYLLLGGLIVLAQRHPQPWLVWIVVSGYGALIEIAQGLFALRSFQWSDIAANSLGAAVGVGIAVLARRRWAAADSRLAAEEPG
jgi:Predicted integral membrane protein